MLPSGKAGGGRRAPPAVPGRSGSDTHALTRHGSPLQLILIKLTRAAGGAAFSLAGERPGNLREHRAQHAPGSPYAGSTAREVAWLMIASSLSAAGHLAAAATLPPPPCHHRQYLSHCRLLVASLLLPAPTLAAAGMRVRNFFTTESPCLHPSSLPLPAAGRDVARAETAALHFACVPPGAFVNNSCMAFDAFCFLPHPVTYICCRMNSAISGSCLLASPAASPDGLWVLLSSSGGGRHAIAANHKNGCVYRCSCTAN